MELEFRPDFESVKARWAAFWEGKNTRPNFWIVTPKPGVTPIPFPSPYLCAFGDFDVAIDKALGWASTHDFLAEAIPSYPITFAPDHFAALLGANIEANPESPNTTWLVPFVKDWDDVEIKFQRDGYWWERTVQCFRAFRKRCDGRVLIYNTQLQGGLDCLSAMRGVNELLMDLMDCPDKVLRALDQVNRAMDEVRLAIGELQDIPRFGDMNRHGFYTVGQNDIPQCDFSCMIGPDMFREFGLPSIIHEANGLTMTDYHLDGPGAIQHLEAIAAIPKIDIIQWQPGAGEAATRDWYDLHKKIDALGKGQVITNPAPERVKRMWKEFSSTKLYFSMNFDSRDQALTFLDEMAKIRKAPRNP